MNALSEKKRAELGERAKCRVRNAYGWEYITNEYAKVFLNH